MFDVSVKTLLPELHGMFSWDLDLQPLPGCVASTILYPGAFQMHREVERI